MDKMIGRKNFISCDALEEEFFEFVMGKKKIVIDIPIVLGFSVLQYAKLRMLEFYYDLIDKYIDRHDFQYCEMDTDSAYLALSDEFHKVIKPELRDEFYTEYGDWFPRAACDLHRSDFVETMKKRGDWEMEPCCRRVNKFDNRTPGLFKEEFIGEGIISLNSKTYYCWTEDGNDDKYRSKGLSRRQNKLTKDQFVSVLQNKEVIGGENRGFTKRENKIFTYSQQRNGLTYLYAKRRVQEDDVSTTPLFI
jgi:hypothetical protein